MNLPNPHAGQPIVAAGAPLSQAHSAMLLIHGRGASPEAILPLAQEFDRPDLACLAPRAVGQTWYPHSFLSPLEANEPFLSSALEAVDRAVKQVEEAGIPAERLYLLGFSQGACLALEYAARHARRYAGVIGLSGGLIGPEGTPRDYPGSLDGTPVFLGCSDVDFHIPLARVEETAVVLTRLGGNVTKRIYPQMGHTINHDEIKFIRQLLAGKQP